MLEKAVQWKWIRKYFKDETNIEEDELGDPIIKTDFEVPLKALKLINHLEWILYKQKLNNLQG